MPSLPRRSKERGLFPWRASRRAGLFCVKVPCFLPPHHLYVYNILIIEHIVKCLSSFSIFFFCFLFLLDDAEGIGYTAMQESCFVGITEKIRFLMVRRGNMSEAELARRMGETPQNFNRKMKRDNFTERDLRRIAEVLNCDYEAGFILKDTGERV